MRKLKLFFACLLMAVLSIGQVWGATADVTYDFTASGWTVSSGTLSNGTASFTGAGSANFKMNGGYFMMGKSGAYINFPTYTSAVSKIVVTGNSGGSASTKMNIYVEETAVSTETTGSTGTNTYEIASASQAAGTTYTLKVTSNHNAQITKIEVFYASGTPTCATPTFDPEDGETFSDDIDVEIAAESGTTIYYTTDGTDPTTSSNVYSSALNFTETTTLKAMAVKEGSNNSEIATATYTKVAPFDGLKLTFDVSSNPGDWPTTNSTTTTNYTYTLNEVDYTFALNNVKCNSGYLMLTSVAKLGLPALSGYKLVKVEATNSSGCSTTTKVKITEDEAGSTVVAGGTEKTWGTVSTKYTYDLSDTEAETMYYLYVSNKNCQLVTLELFYEETEAPLIPKAAKPTFETGEESFVVSTSVTLACATEGANIYYTTNGDVPTSASELYDGAIPVSTTTTIKAIAVADGYDNSAVAEKTFTKVEALESLAALLEATTSTETGYNVVISDWVVTGAISNRAWISNAENTKGILLYKSGHGFTAGKKLNGVVLGTKAKIYQGYPELTSLVSTEVTVSDAAEITPRETTLAAIVSGYNVEQGTLVKLENVTYAASAGFSDGINTVALNTQLYGPTMVDGATYNIIGVVRYDNGPVYSIMPRSVDDVEQISGGGLPEVDGLAALKAEATGASYLLNLTDAIVTLVDGSNAFIEDATAGALIYKSGHGFSAGDKLNGQYEVTTTTYQGKFEITAIAATTGTKTTDAAIPETTLTIAQLNANFAANESKRIKIVGVNVTDAVESGDATARTGEISDGENTITLYAGKSGVTAAENANIDVIGYPTFHNTDQQLAVWAQADITVNEKEDPELSYSPASVNLTVGDALSAPTFNNPHTLSPITYNTDNDAVATVDEYGAITLVGATGTAVITASYAGDATYNVGNATFTINVYDPAAAPKNVVIIAEYNTKFYAMSTALNTTSNYCPAIEVEKDGGNIVVTSAEDKAAIQWSMAVDEGVSPKTASFQAGVDEYLKGTSGGAGLSFATTPFDWEWDDTNNCYIVSSSTRGFFYKNDGIFKNYALSNLSNAAYAGVEIIEIDPENIVISSKVDPELAYTPNELEIAAEDVASWSTPVLGYVDGFDGLAAITYQSNNESVATVTEGGAIALAGGYGTATITATFGGNTNYLAGSATYTITVNAPAPTPSGTTYTKVTSTGDITDGEYLIVYEEESVAFNGDLTTLDAANNTVSVVISGDEIAGTTAIDAAVFTIDVANGTLRSHMGDYIGVSTYGNGLKQNASANYPAHTFAIDGDNAVISIYGETWNSGGPGSMILNYNKGVSDKRFRYYKGGSQQPIQLYKKETVTPPATKYTVTYAANGGSGDVPAVVEYEEGETFSVAAADLFTAPEGKEFDKWNDGSNDYAPGDTYTVGTSDVVLTAYWKDAAPAPVYETVRAGLNPNHYYTICYPKAMTDIQGATLWSFVGRDANFAYIEQETATTIEAGKPYIMYATASTVTAILGDETNAPGANGAIHGTFNNLTQEQLNTYANVAGNDLYLVIGNELRRATGPSTGSNTLPAQRAFVVVNDIPSAPAHMPAHVRKMPMQGQTTTGCELINAAEAPAKMMINGQLYILRGEKKYDATGRLVK